MSLQLLMESVNGKQMDKIFINNLFTLAIASFVVDLSRASCPDSSEFFLNCKDVDGCCAIEN